MKKRSKYFLVIIFLLQVSNVEAQFVEGNYCIDLGEGYECLTFDDNKFILSGFDCTYSVYGKGSFAILDDFLILNFDSSGSLEGNKVKIDYFFSESDSIDIEVFLYSIADNFKLNGGLITVMDEADNETKTIVDTSGFANIKFGKTNSELKLTASYIGYRTETLKINVNFDYRIKIGMVDSFPVKYIHKGIRYIYQIKSYNKDKIILSRLNSDYEIEYGLQD
jgi:hypothetical protein